MARAQRSPAAGAQRLASGSYSSAVSAERDAERLYAAGRLGDAADKFHEASGLYAAPRSPRRTNDEARRRGAHEEPFT